MALAAHSINGSADFWHKQLEAADPEGRWTIKNVFRQDSIGAVWELSFRSRLHRPLHLFMPHRSSFGKSLIHCRLERPGPGEFLKPL
ncbi:MAG: hypothetical protein CMJ95_14335 [Planctomycetes bacterium]|nr:hypothetical protein [Planctomycetota bacterium]